MNKPEKKKIKSEDKIGFGIAIGVAIGAAIGISLQEKNKNDSGR
ncbi:hypothetical protein [Microbulbifer hydrolyticus]|uniref:Uncharacterized protein n=1 Tax=Microbulbifer hydrolyticus TaxID=48074 RepID=A0AA89T7C5_9GAMM|nr:hypothetical protein [Microbulbifer hydrolyticus]MBB5213235.1 hypothetical protein [Microbulbifer hydrolyticus]